MADESAPLATVDDLRAAGVDIGPADEGRASFVLDLASTLIRSEEGPDASPDTERLVCISVSRRALGAVADGVTQQSQTTGPFTESFTFGNPYGDLFLTKAERTMLGAHKVACGSISRIGGADE